MMRRLFSGMIFTLLTLTSSYSYALSLRSSAFDNGEYIPVKYTCSGEDYSPPLSWNDIPSGTESFAIICDDPDAPIGVWVHWVVFNIPKNITELKENILPSEELPNGIRQGINDFRRIGYGGPCPPYGKPHRYFFKLYALDTKLSLKGKVTKKELLKVIKGHIIEKATLVGLYQR